MASGKGVPNSPGFSVGNFLKDTLANKPQFLDTIRLRGHEIRGPAKARQNSLLPGESDLIDQKSLFDADNVIAETDFFLNRVSEERPRNTMMEKMKKLARTTKPNPANSAYNQLCQRLSISEQKLKSVVEDAVAQESSYTLQALHLTIRVGSCINFNKSALPEAKKELEEGLELEAQLDNWMRFINSMAKFQQELNYLQEAQNRYIPKLFLHSEENAQEAAKQKKDKVETEKKFKKIKKLNAKVKAIVAKLNQVCNTRELNYSNLVYSNNVLNGMLERQGYGPEEIKSQIWMKEIRKENHAAHRRRSATTHMKAVTGSPEEIAAALQGGSGGGGGGGNGTGGEDGEDEEDAASEELIVYDHSQCNDCAVVHSMVTECVMQLAAKTLQAEEGTRRLQRVLELEARMQEVKAIAEDFE